MKAAIALAILSKAHANKAYFDVQVDGQTQQLYIDQFYSDHCEASGSKITC